MVSYGLAMRAVEIKLTSGTTETEVRCLRQGIFYEQQKKDKSFKLVTAITVSFIQQVFFHTQTSNHWRERTAYDFLLICQNIILWQEIGKCYVSSIGNLMSLYIYIDRNILDYFK